MSMFETIYSSTDDTHEELSEYHKLNNDNVVIERTEELPEQKENGETKKRFQERGGVTYIRGAEMVESSEFNVLGDDGNMLSLKNYKGTVGLYRVSEDGKHTLLIN